MERRKNFFVHNILINNTQVHAFTLKSAYIQIAWIFFLKSVCFGLIKTWASTWVEELRESIELERNMRPKAKLISLSFVKVRAYSFLSISLDFGVFPARFTRRLLNFVQIMQNCWQIFSWNRPWLRFSRWDRANSTKITPFSLATVIDHIGTNDLLIIHLKWIVEITMQTGQRFFPVFRTFSADKF